MTHSDALADPSIAVNARFRGRAMTGVDRVAIEIIKHSSMSFRLIEPGRASKVPGLLWEQSTLPARLRFGELLWSPCNSGPLFVRNQILTLHDVAPLDEPASFTNAYRVSMRTRMSILLKNVTHVVTVSAFSKSRILKHYPSLSTNNVSVIPLGTELPEKKPFTNLVSRDRPYIVTLGSEDPRKNIPLLILAWSASGLASKGYELVIMGGTNPKVFAMTPDPAGDSREAAGVVRLGRVSEIERRAVLRGALGYAGLSRYEGFGLPPLEAAAEGCPIVVSDIPAHREHGLKYRFVKLSEMEDIVESLRDLVNGQVHPPDMTGYRTWSEVAQDYENVFRDFDARSY